MVARILSLVVCLSVVLAVTNPIPAIAAYCGPTGCPPQKIPVYPPMPAFPAAKIGPAPMSCMPNCLPACPPPCPPPGYGPPPGTGFNPLSAIFSAITLPFRLIAGAMNRGNYQPPMYCPPPGCMPMCAPPATKVKPGKRAAYGGPVPMLNPMVQ